MPCFDCVPKGSVGMETLWKTTKMLQICNTASASVPFETRNRSCRRREYWALHCDFRWPRVTGRWNCGDGRRNEGISVDTVIYCS